MPEQAPELSQTVEVALTNTRRSTRTTRYQQFMGEGTRDRHYNEENLEVRQIPGMGNALITLVNIGDDEVICTYNGECRSTFIKDRKTAYKGNYNLYTLVIHDIDHWVRVDVRDPHTGLSRSVGGNAADAINVSGNTSYWNARFEVDDIDPAILIIRSTRPITEGELTVPWYGPAIWCNNQHSIGILIMAIKTYGINIDHPTPEQGPWRNLREFKRIKRILAAEGWVPPTLPTTQPSLPLTVMPIPTVDQAGVANKSSRVSIPPASTSERFVISLCCMKAVMAKATRTEDREKMFRGMVDLGANIAMGPPVLALLLDIRIEPHTDERKIGTADREGSLTILGWITVPGYAGRIAMVEGAAFTLLSVIQLQGNGMGVHCPPNSLTCRLTVMEEGVEVDYMVLQQEQVTNLFFVDIRLLYTTVSLCLCHNRTTTRDWKIRYTAEVQGIAHRRIIHTRTGRRKNYKSSRRRSASRSRPHLYDFAYGAYTHA